MPRGGSRGAGDGRVPRPRRRIHTTSSAELQRGGRGGPGAGLDGRARPPFLRASVHPFIRSSAAVGPPLRRAGGPAGGTEGGRGGDRGGQGLPGRRGGAGAAGRSRRSGALWGAYLLRDTGTQRLASRGPPSPPAAPLAAQLAHQTPNFPGPLRRPSGPNSHPPGRAQLRDSALPLCGAPPARRGRGQGGGGGVARPGGGGTEVSSQPTITLH